MPRYILTGAPGAGKTALLRALELAGHPVVEEAATDVIALDLARGVGHPREDPASFVRDVLRLQMLRAERAEQAERAAPADAGRTRTVIFDRSEVCTLALARYVGVDPPAELTRRVARVVADGWYARDVLFVRTIGSTTRTTARLISHDEALRFEQIHLDTYRELGFRLVEIPPGSVDQRMGAVLGALAR